jgi:hypothetical protein
MQEDSKTLSELLDEFAREWSVAEKMETMEREYRRGYKDGWLMAVERLGDMIFDRDISPKDAFVRLQFHVTHDLWRWAHRGNYSVQTEPPICALVPLGDAEGDDAPHPQWDYLLPDDH